MTFHGPTSSDRLLLGIGRGAGQLSFGVGLAIAVGGWWLSSPGLLILALVMTVPIPLIVWWSGRLILRHRVEAAVIALSCNLFLLTLALGPLGRGALPVTVASGLVPIIFAAAFSRGPLLKRILFASVVVLAAASLLALVGTPLTLEIEWLESALVVVTLGVAGFIGLSVWRLSERLTVTEAIAEATDRRRRAVVSSLRAKEEVTLELSNEKKALQRSVNELSELNELSRVLNSTLDLDRVLQATLEAVQRLVAVDHMGVLKLDETGAYLRLDRLVGRRPEGADDERLGSIGIPMDNEDSAIVAAARAGRTAYFARVAEPLLSPTDWAFYRLNPVKTVVFCPLEIQGELIGGAFFANSDEFVNLSIEDMRTLERYSVVIATAVNNAGLFEEVRAARARMTRELEVGRGFQEGFFPSSLPRGPGVEVAAVFEPAREMSGDFYDAFELGSDGRFVGLVVADVCDKGVGAALFMSIFRSLIRGTALAEAAKEGFAPAALLSTTIQTTNDYVAEHHGDASMFATVFLAVADTESGHVWYTNAGHEAPVICSSTGVRMRLDPTGPAAGMLPAMDFEILEVELQPEETLVIFTDGATEALDRAGRLFSEEKLLELLARPEPTARETLEMVRDRVSRHVGPREPSDDITLLALRRSS